MHDFFGETIEPIDTYSRAEALADGALVDVTETAREAGFTVPVALTAAVHADCEDLTGKHIQGGEDYAGRLWDLLYMASMAARKHHNRDASEFVFSLIMPVGERNNYRAKVVAGAGDEGEPVITIMAPEES